MPTLKNCERCGKVFNAEGADALCPGCNIEDAKDLKKVNDYLRDHPLASMMEVTQKTGLPQQLLLRFIKKGSLKMRKPLEEFKCRLCGTDIKMGTLCEACRAKIEGMQKKRKNNT
jgi:uncharacterized protein